MTERARPRVSGERGPCSLDDQEGTASAPARDRGHAPPADHRGVPETVRESVPGISPDAPAISSDPGACRRSDTASPSRFESTAGHASRPIH